MLAFGLCSCDRTGLRAEFMVGYSHLRSAETNFNGWKTTLVGNVNHWLGVEADFDGHYAGAESEHSITCGPHFVVRRNKKLAPIGYALFRVAIKKSESGGTAHGFDMELGCGLDYEVRYQWALRVLDAPESATHIGGNSCESEARVRRGV